MRRHPLAPFVLPLCLLALASPLAGQSRGSLFIVGGGPRPDSLMQHFTELAGGAANARVLVLPMAAANAPAAGEAGVREFERRGVTARTVVLDSAAAERSETAELFRWANAVWFPGGVQTRITRAMRGTAAERALHELYDRGGVIGGTSAGAAVMSALMITGSERKLGGARPPRDSSEAFITIDRANVVTERGFGLLENAIVDQHFVRRKRHNRLISLVLESGTPLGAGIDEGTALIVQPNGTWRVAGESVVLIFDARAAGITSAGTLAATGLHLHILRAGDVFEPASGTARGR